MKNNHDKETFRKKLEIKKEMTEFLKDEKGFVSKETMLKVGLITLSGLTLLSGMEAQAATHSSHWSHNSSTPTISSMDADGSSVNISHRNQASVHSSHNSY